MSAVVLYVRPLDVMTVGLTSFYMFWIEEIARERNGIERIYFDEVVRGYADDGVSLLLSRHIVK